MGAYLCDFPISLFPGGVLLNPQLCRCGIPNMSQNFQLFSLICFIFFFLFFSISHFFSYTHSKISWYSSRIRICGQIHPKSSLTELPLLQKARSYGQANISTSPNLTYICQITQLTNHQIWLQKYNLEGKSVQKTTLRISITQLDQELQSKKVPTPGNYSRYTTHTSVTIAGKLTTIPHTTKHTKEA
jgi:hypothetical protein